MTGQGRIEEVDVLRAVAMTMVVAQHCGLMPFGWTGVWLFYVISGYVITRNFRRGPAHSGPWAEYAAFMARRFFRIVPVYVLYLALATAALMAMRPLVEARDLPFLLTFTHNWQMIFGLWPPAGAFPPFGHLWTLSVEEQFYVLFPLLYLLLPRPRLVLVAALLVLLGPAVRALFSHVLSSAGYAGDQIAYGVYAASICHFDAFLMGALVALKEPQLIAQPRWRRLLFTLAAIAVVGYAATMVAVNSALGAQGIDLLRRIYSGTLAGQGREILVYVAVDLAAVALVVAAVTRQRLLAAVARPWIVWVGQVSYGAYLYHALVLWLVLGAISTAHAPPASLAGRLALFAVVWGLTVLVASLSYVAFERRVSAWSRRRFAL